MTDPTMVTASGEAGRGPAEIGEPRECFHPYRAVFWNPHNRCVQCHVCGFVIARATDRAASK